MKKDVKLGTQALQTAAMMLLRGHWRANECCITSLNDYFKM